MNHTIPVIVALLLTLPAHSQDVSAQPEASPAQAESPPEQPEAAPGQVESPPEQPEAASGQVEDVAETAAAVPAPAQDVSVQFDCIELELFTVNKDDVTDSAEARATMIPPEKLVELRDYIASEIPLEMPGMKTRLVPEQQCDDDERSLVFGGRVTDYKKGNQAARYLVGFGAGKQKFAVDAVLKRKSDGSVIAQDEVVDRKVGGLFGGSKDKGKQDFAEKVADFIHEGLTGKKAH
jgi:hypothetical protein